MEEEGSEKFKNSFIDPKYFAWDEFAARNAIATSDLELTLIGDGLLASRLATHIRNMKIKFNQIKSCQIVSDLHDPLSSQLTRGNEKPSPRDLTSWIAIESID